jgi:hypothetical protein
MKSYTAKNRILCFFIIVMLFCGAPLFAQDNQYEVIGRIVQAKGAVRAVSAQGDSRQLLRRSEIFAQDAIVTGADGFVQIRMVDSAIIALKKTPNSFSTNTALMVKVVLLIAPSWNWCVVDSELLMV